MRVKNVTPRHPLWHVKSWGDVVLTWRDELIAELKGAFREALMPLRGSGNTASANISRILSRQWYDRHHASGWMRTVARKKDVWGKSARGEHMCFVLDDD